MMWVCVTNRPMITWSVYGACHVQFLGARDNEYHRIPAAQQDSKPTFRRMGICLSNQFNNTLGKFPCHFGVLAESKRSVTPEGAFEKVPPVLQARTSIFASYITAGDSYGLRSFGCSMDLPPEEISEYRQIVRIQHEPLECDYDLCPADNRQIDGGYQDVVVSTPA